MTNFLTATPSLDPVPQLETITLAIGGSSGVMNTQAQALLNRIEYVSSHAGASNAIVQGNSSFTVTDAGINGSIELKLDGNSILRASKLSYEFKTSIQVSDSWVSIFGQQDKGTDLLVGTATAIDSVGNTYVAGGFDNSNKAVIIKYDLAGNLLWQKLYSITNEYVFGEAIAIDLDNNIYACLSTSVNNSCSLVKISGVDGTIIWQQYLDTNNAARFWNCTVDNDNNPIIGGIGSQNSNVIVVKVNKDTGLKIWGTEFLSAYYVEDITIDTNNNIYLVGQFNNLNSNLSTVKLDTNGIVQWNKDIIFSSYVQSIGYSIVSGLTGVYVGGNYDDGLGGVIPTILKLSIDTGNVMWCKHITDPSYSYANPLSILVNQVTENLYVTLTGAISPVGKNVTLTLDSNGNLISCIIAGPVSGYLNEWNSSGHKDTALRGNYLVMTGTTTQYQNDIFTMHIPLELASATSDFQNNIKITSSRATLESLTANAVDNSVVTISYTPPQTSSNLTAIDSNYNNLIGYKVDLIDVNMDVCTINTLNVTAFNSPRFYFDQLMNNGLGLSVMSNMTNGNNNNAIGNSALKFTTTGNGNNALGSYALTNNTVGQDNNACGTYALANNTTGYGNNALGSNTLSSNIEGFNSNAMGLYTLYNNTTGYDNNIIGAWALYNNTTGYRNNGMGSLTLSSNTIGYDNNAIGAWALTNNNVGYQNTAIGTRALGNNTEGANNIGLGYYALNSSITGYNNIGIGYHSGDDSMLNITTESNQIVMGNNDHTDAFIKIAWTVTSDARDKTNITPLTLGLDFVSKLKPVSYQFRTSRKDDTPTGRVRNGFIAQDILELEGNNPVIINNNDEDNLKFNESSLVPMLVNAIKELKEEVEKLTAQVTELRQKEQ
jgi:hypothetical protein